MDYHNSMDRLAAIVSIMVKASNYDFGKLSKGNVLNPSVKEISRFLRIPDHVVRRDMQVLIKNSQLKEYLWCYDSIEEREKDRVHDEKGEIKDWAQSAVDVLEEGKFTDDTIVVLELGNLGGLGKYEENDQCAFFTTESDSVLLSYLFQQLTGYIEKIRYQGALTDAVVIKQNVMTPIVQFDEEKRLCIQQVMEFGRQLSFDYTDRNKYKTRKTIEPRLLYHNLANGHMYCITLNDAGDILSYRLDRMENIEMSNEVQSDPGERGRIFKQFEYLWGMDLTDIENPPVHVKIRISAEPRNLYNKIRADVDRRVHKKLYQEGEYFYYEDDVIGMKDFRSWLYQFGYSVVVLEPKELAQEVYRSAQRRLRNYQEKKFTPYIG